MGRVSGVGRLLNGAGKDRAFRQNAVELRGFLWEAVTDYFFGYNTAGYSWDQVIQEDKVTKWIYTQDGADVSDHTVTPAKREMNVGLTTANVGDEFASNQRELFTIPETGLWGIAHALLEIKSERYSLDIREAGALTGVEIIPQHGIGLRAQEDTKRRAIIVWHDVVIGNPHAINVGVWQGNLDGSGFSNRQGNFTMSLAQNYDITAGTRTGGTVTATCTAHGLLVGEYINIAWVREFASAAVTRSGNVVTATLPSGHEFQSGDQVNIGSASPGSFGGTFNLTGVGATTVTWAQTGSNESGTATVKDQSNDYSQVQISEVATNTFKYVDGGHNLTSMGTSPIAQNARNFPYYMEVKVEGTVVYVRCWGRHQTAPSWTVPDGRMLVIDLDKVNQNYTVTASSRTSNIATLTIGAHDFMVGNRINVDITDATGDTSNGTVSAITATTVSYLNTGANDADMGTGTCTRVGGAVDAASLASMPTPRGTGRIAIVAAHMGLEPEGHCSYGAMLGDNSLTTTLGLGAGTFTFTGQGNGVAQQPAVQGSVSQTFTFTGTAIGNPRKVGSASQTILFTGTANGRPRKVGSASQTISFTGTANGRPRHIGAVAQTFVFTGQGNGIIPPVPGTVSQIYQFSGTATGIRRARGVATTTITFTGSGQGVARKVGIANQTIPFSASASGISRKVGSSTTTFSLITAATGQREVFGSISQTFAFTGQGDGFAGTPPVVGEAAATFAFTATGQGTHRVLAIASVSVTLTATANGIARKVGVATSTIPFNGSGSGVVQHHELGIGLGQFQFSASSMGRVRKYGSATATFVFTSMAIGETPDETHPSEIVGVSMAKRRTGSPRGSHSRTGSGRATVK
jgi:hypothetical protein